MNQTFKCIIGFILSIVISGGIASAQNIKNNHSWKAGISLGGLTYYGDLSNSLITNKGDFLDINPESPSSFGANVFLERRLGGSFGILAQGGYGTFSANDRSVGWDNKLETDNPNFRRSLNFKTDITEASASLVYHFDNGYFLKKNATVAPYFTIGVGVTNFDVKANLFSGDSTRYHYWSDFSIRTKAEYDPDADQAVKIEQDKDYETSLVGLNTESNEAYSTTIIHIPVGLGVNFRISDRMELGLQAQLKYTFSDYLDDVSGTYRTSYDNSLQEYAANPGDLPVEGGTFRGDPNGKDDMYAFGGISLAYRFGIRLKKFKSPTINAFPVAIVPGSAIPAEKPAEKTASAPIETPVIVIDPVIPEVPVIKVPEQVSAVPIEIAPEDSLDSDKTEAIAIPAEVATEDSVASVMGPTAAVSDSMVTDSMMEKVVATPTPVTKAPDQGVTYVTADPEMKSQINRLQTTIDSLLFGLVKALQVRPAAPAMVAAPMTKAAPAPLADNSRMSSLELQLREVKDQMARQEEALRKLQSQPATVRAQPVTVETTTSPPPKSDPAIDRLSEQMKAMDKKINALIIGGTAAGTAAIASKPSKKGTGSSRQDSLTIATLSQQVATLNSRMDSIKSAENRELQQKVATLQGQLALAKNEPPIIQTKVDTVVKTIERTVVQTKVDTVLVPKTKTVIVTEGITGIRTARLFFAQGSFTIMKQDLPALDSIANTLKENPGVKLFIRGYADKGTGSQAINLQLSKRRAEVVKTYLSGIGVPDKQMTVEAYGDTEPVYKNSMDRRVDLELIF